MPSRRASSKAWRGRSTTAKTPVAKNFYMAGADGEGRRCVVVGDGGMAAEKAAGLEACGAVVDRVPAAKYKRRLLRGAFVVVAATDDRGVNERVFRDAEKRGMLCNVAD